MVTEVRFGNEITGFVARPKREGRNPAVINLHERYGTDKHTTDLTQKLADAGYVGFAPDLFSRFTGDREALRRGDVQVEIRDDEAVSDLNEAIDYLRTLNYVDGGRIAVMGVCQSGRQPLLIAAHRDDVSSAIVFYGGVGRAAWEPHELQPAPVSALIERIECPVVGIFGEKDHVIAVEDVLRFRDHLEGASKSFRIRIYPEVPHGWLNDTMPGRYRAEEAEDAWKLLLRFLEETFGDTWDRSRFQWSLESDISTTYDFSKNVRMA